MQFRYRTAYRKRYCIKFGDDRTPKKRFLLNWDALHAIKAQAYQQKPNKCYIYTEQINNSLTLPRLQLLELIPLDADISICLGRATLWKA